MAFAMRPAISTNGKRLDPGYTGPPLLQLLRIIHHGAVVRTGKHLLLPPACLGQERLTHGPLCSAGACTCTPQLAHLD